MEGPDEAWRGIGRFLSKEAGLGADPSTGKETIASFWGSVPEMRTLFNGR